MFSPKILYYLRGETLIGFIALFAAMSCPLPPPHTPQDFVIVNVIMYFCSCLYLRAVLVSFHP